MATATGQIVETKRPRYEDNERFDEVDAQAEGELRIVREQMLVKALTGGLLPFISGNGGTIGMVMQGGSIVGSAGPGTVTLGAELLVAVDADGGMIIKSATTGAITISVPSGQSTVYAYSLDNPSDSDVRAFIPAKAPFTEFQKATSTRFTSSVGLIAVSGDSTVRDTVVNGVTRPLVAIALVNNLGGTVTITKQFTNVLQTVPPLALARTNDTPYTISLSGTAGVTSWSYVVVARGRKGALLKVSQVSTILGVATLSSGNPIGIQFTPLPEAQDYLVYRTAAGGTPSSTGLITPTPIVLPPGLASNVTFFDTGIAGDSSTAPTSTQSSVVAPLNNTDRGAGGSTSLTVTDLLRSVMTLLADVKFKGSLRGAQTNKQQATQDFGLFSTLRRGLDATDRSTNTTWTIGDGVLTFGDFDLTEYADFNALLADLFATINATAQLTLPNSRTVLNDKFTVLLKPGTYALTGDITTPANVAFAAEGGTEVTVTQTASIGAFAVNTAGRVKLTLAGHKLTLADGGTMRNLIVQGGAGGQVILNGHNLMEECTFWQQYALGVIPGNDPLLISNLTPPTGGVSDLTVRRCRFFCFNNGGNTLTNGNSETQTTGLVLTSARNVLVEGCLFATDTQFTGYTANQKPVCSAQLTLASTKENVVVRRCEFDMYDDLYSAGASIEQAALLITAATAAEANKSIRIQNCDFSLRNWQTGALGTTAISCVYRGIRVNEEINVIVEGCQFALLNDCVYFFMAALSSHTYAMRSTSVRGCTFTGPSGATGNAIRVDSSGVANVTVRGFEVSDNTFIGCYTAITLGNSNTASPIRFELANIQGNKFLDGIGICINCCLRGTQGFVITNNLVETNQSYFLSMQCISPNTLVDITISNNTIRNIIQFGTAIQMNCTGPTGGYEQVTIQNNNFSFLLGALNPISVGSDHCVFIDGGSHAEIDFSHNTFTACGTSMQAGSTRPYYLMIRANASASGDFLQNINVADNVFGDAGSRFEAVLITKNSPGSATVFSKNIGIHNNSFAANYSTGTPPPGVTWKFGDSGVGDKWANVSFCHNRTYYEAASAVTFNNDSFALQLANIAGLEFIGNMWFGNGTWAGGKGALLAAAGGIATSVKSIVNTATNLAAGATGFTYFVASGYAVGNTSA